MRNIVYFFMLVFIVSCNDVSNSEISKKIEKDCKSQNCEINMANYIVEDWDYMFIFKVNTSLEQINSQLGFTYPYFEDIANRIIFVKGDKIIYHEDEFPNPEKVKKGELIFNIGDENFIKIKKDKAIFLVRMEGDFFELKLKDDTNS
jgi:hypothetical protein